MTRFEQKWKELDGERGPLGKPVTGVVSVASGQAIYYQYGCLWAPTSPDAEVVPMILEAPMLGQPKLVRTSADQARIHICECDAPLPVLEQVWQGRIVLRPVVKTGSSKKAIVFTLDPHRGTNKNHLTIALPGGNTLSDRTLYDICYRPPQAADQVVSCHSVYAKSSWDNFNFAHVTDIHISKRLDSLGARLRQAHLNEGADNLNNYNDRFRDFVRYANAMHEAGDLDMVIATGDLVDYLYEDGDDREGPGNFGLFEEIILGRSPFPDSHISVEELRVPIFTVLGNHDYRRNAYPFAFDLTIRPLGVDIALKSIKQFDTLNLTNSEGEILFGERIPLALPFPSTVVTWPNFSSSEAGGFLAVDEKMRNRTSYYFRRINRDGSYIIRAGTHRIVMLDSRWDAGLPEGKWDAFWAGLGNGSEDTIRLVGGGPNSQGPQTSDMELLRLAVHEAKQKGIVVVGIHAPLLNIAGNEYAHYFRETEHSVADPKDVTGFLWRHLMGMFLNGTEPSLIEPDWMRSNTPYFKRGSTGDLLDDGISRGVAKQILNLCMGSGLSRPADLVLFGHVHRNVEYRSAFNPQQNQIFFYHDYYLSDPAEYYPSKKVTNGDFRQSENVPVFIHPQAMPGGSRVKVRDHRTNTEYVQFRVPPCLNSLGRAANAAQWWRENRPVLAQTGPLGPIEFNQRVEEGKARPKPIFQGCRVFSVENQTIARAAYVRTKDIKAPYQPPWATIAHPGRV